MCYIPCSYNAVHACLFILVDCSVPNSVKPASKSILKEFDDEQAMKVLRRNFSNLYHVMFLSNNLEDIVIELFSGELITINTYDECMNKRQSPCDRASTLIRTLIATIDQPNNLRKLITALKKFQAFECAAEVMESEYKTAYVPS